MGNEEHLKILKQGVEVWNKWRKENPDIKPDLKNVDLSNEELSFIDFTETNLVNVNLSNADLSQADLRSSDLTKVNLTEANLNQANLTAAILYKADLRRASLMLTYLLRANLAEANLENTILSDTAFGDTDLKNARGLDSCIHILPSIIDFKTIQRSGTLPIEFLRGCGLPDTYIEYLPTFLKQPIQYYSCFISHSRKDKEFADRLYDDMRKREIDCYYAPADMRTGDKIRPAIDEAIKKHDRLIVVLSKHSIDSPWVESEVETAFEKERKSKLIVLFPIRLDDDVMKTKQPWAAEIRRTRHIGDFLEWENPDKYQESLDKLIGDLKPTDKPKNK